MSSSESVEYTSDSNDDNTINLKGLKLNKEQEILNIRRASAQNIGKLSQHISNLIDKYSDESSSDVLDDPLRVFDEMSDLSGKIKQEWDTYYSKLKEIEIKFKPDEDEFREAYMSMMTEAFSDELEDIRKGKIRTKKKNNVPDILQQENIVMPDDFTQEGSSDCTANTSNVQVDVLVHLLGHGMDRWTDEEKMLLLEDMSTNDEENMDIDELTPHERRKLATFGATK
jgi:predicted ATP-dependent Lon-type protease